MKVVIESANDLCEVENLLMMADSCQRHFNHSHAVRAVKALRTARNEYIEKVMPLFVEERPPYSTTREIGR